MRCNWRLFETNPQIDCPACTVAVHFIVNSTRNTSARGRWQKDTRVIRDKSFPRITTCWKQRCAFVNVTLRDALEGTLAKKWSAPRGNTTQASSLADVNVGLQDVVERRVVEFAGSFIRETWLLQHSDATGDSSRLLVPSSNELGLRTVLA